MHDPSHPLQVALVARLTAAVPLVDGRVYDRIPANAVFPYIEIGHSQAVPDDAPCVNAVTCYVTLHVWSRVVGAVEARKISDQVTRALSGWEPEFPAETALAYAGSSVNSAQTMADPDGISTHSVITFECDIELI